MCDRIGALAQRYVLDPFHAARSWLLNAAVWAAIRLTAYEVTFAEVRGKTKPSNRVHGDLDLDAAGDLEGLSKHAEGQVKDAVARRGIVTDKCKTLFTFNTALLALIAVFQGKAVDLRSWEVWAFYAAVVSFVVALLVIWTYFDVGGELTVPLEQAAVPLGEADLQKSLVNSNLRCASDLENRTDYLVDLYKTARFYMMLGFVLLFVVFSRNFLSADRSAPTPATPVNSGPIK